MIISIKNTLTSHNHCSKLNDLVKLFLFCVKKYCILLTHASLRICSNLLIKFIRVNLFKVDTDIF